MSLQFLRALPVEKCQTFPHQRLGSAMPRWRRWGTLSRSNSLRFWVKVISARSAPGKKNGPRWIFRHGSGEGWNREIHGNSIRLWFISNGDWPWACETNLVRVSWEVFCSKGCYTRLIKSSHIASCQLLHVIHWHKPPAAKSRCSKNCHMDRRKQSLPCSRNIYFVYFRVSWCVLAYIYIILSI